VKSETERGELERALTNLLDWCRARDFAGHDPFDGLNSRIFQATPLKSSRAARLIWTQLFKRSPVNLRALARVPAGKNPKGIALFALAALAQFRTEPNAETEEGARALMRDLLAARLEGGSGAAWGYNFDWQGRAFFAPKGTPTVVPTAFAARALVEAAREFDDASYLRTARSACEFILRDLHRTEETNADEVCWSYSPLDRTRVFNASLLAAETLSAVGALTGEEELSMWAIKGARYVVRRQREDGSWAYGAEGFQSWADNFHTAFVLTSLSRIMAHSSEARAEFASALKRGYEFWRAAFFLADGWPRYYHNKLYPADAHSAGAGIVALLEMQDQDQSALDWANRVAHWTIKNLSDPRGFFYYQRRRFYTVRIPYMRWSQAWMTYALARLREQVGRRKDEG
jgi:hypothetical protein